MRIFASLLILAAVVVACNNSSTVTLTADEQLAYDIEIIDTYLTENQIDAIKLESGVRYVIDQMGTGAPPTKDDCVRIRYRGYLLNETVPFDTNSNDFGLKLALKKLVVGMQIGLKQMPLGTKGTIYIPSGLAYGPNPDPGVVVGRNAVLKFDVEVTEITRYNALGDYCN